MQSPFFLTSILHCFDLNTLNPPQLLSGSKFLHFYWRLRLRDLKRDYNQDGGLLAGFKAVLHLRHRGLKQNCGEMYKNASREKPQENVPRPEGFHCGIGKL